MIEEIYYDRQGQVIPFARYQELRRGPAYRQVASETFVRSGVGFMRVSTVWIGINLRSSQMPPPLIFETMIINGRYDAAFWHYATEQEALAGHARVLAALDAGKDPREDEQPLPSTPA